MGIDHLFADFLPPIALSSREHETAEKEPVAKVEAPKHKRAGKAKPAPKQGTKQSAKETLKAPNEQKRVQSAPLSVDPPEIKPPLVKKQKPSGKRSGVLPTGKLKIASLGGLNEIGKNMTVIEYENDMIVVDCGLGFPDDDMPGVDLVIPDTSYLEQNREKLRGIFFTHGHEDHIGAVPYVLRSLDTPLYGTRLTLGIIKNKLVEHKLPREPRFCQVKAGDVVRAGALLVEFIHVNHSIADACCLAIHTPLGTVIHTGDFKLDVTPIDGEMMDLTRLGELGREGVLMLLCESTNAERAGHTPSEKNVGKSLEYIFNANEDKRIVIATFSSNVHRVQQIIDASARHGRKVAVTGRSMLNILNAAIELGYMNVPEGVIVDISEIRRYSPNELTLITTGSQGEPMSALYRMAFGEHQQVTLGSSDLVVLSSSAIPGNEKLVGRIINELSRNGVSVLHDAVVEVHVSGHACAEELKLMQALTKPKYFMPIHGEYRHLAANRALALDMGMAPDHIFISDIGKVLEIDRDGVRFGGTVPSGIVLVDGLGVGDVGNIVLRDRKHLSQDGLITVVACIEPEARLLLSGPDIVSRGFVYVRESESLMEDIKKVAADVIEEELRASWLDRAHLKTRVKDELARYLYGKTKRKPMILPIIMDV
ncbi:MAG: ribonuclease J [Clostridia bacterium]|nr:ribonuclease J [Clostridia bacterium]